LEQLPLVELGILIPLVIMALRATLHHLEHFLGAMVEAAVRVEAQILGAVAAVAAAVLRRAHLQWIHRQAVLVARHLHHLLQQLYMPQILAGLVETAVAVSLLATQVIWAVVVVVEAANKTVAVVHIIQVVVVGAGPAVLLVLELQGPVEIRGPL
jgi:hypothetical protein